MATYKARMHISNLIPTVHSMYITGCGFSVSWSTHDSNRVIFGFSGTAQGYKTEMLIAGYEITCNEQRTAILLIFNCFNHMLSITFTDILLRFVREQINEYFYFYFILFIVRTDPALVSVMFVNIIQFCLQTRHVNCMKYR